MPTNPSGGPTARTNAADPARLLLLLWGDGRSTRRGPARSLDVESVVSAGIALADGTGLTSLTIRGLAAHLGIGAMSLYTYVPGKAELVDLMVDRLYLDMDRPAMPSLRPAARIRAVAEANWHLCRAHPWIVRVATTRPGLGPGATAKYEYELGAFQDLGLTDVETDSWLTLLLTVVRGAASLALEVDQARAESGESDQEWWDRAGPVLAAHVTPEEYPLATRIGAAAGAAHGGAVDGEHVFRFGVAKLLDALGCSAT
ncbi:MAG: TetR/AcrR family transcriptional regulator C-terminal domain-containing protein [Propionibacteriaceae bacterium]|nr:TetR/AcrR family transcriptional regulator C-terminal domain-containing protein [Propionibacteriaceae bacterium]